MVPGREYTPAQYPLLAAAFLGAVGFTARTRVTVGRQRVREAIRFLERPHQALARWLKRHVGAAGA